MKPADLRRLVSVGDPCISPDGRTIAFVVTRVDIDANRYRSAIWLAPLDGSAPAAQLTAGTDADAGPAWSPNGRRLAFTRSTAKPARSSLHLLAVDGPGELLTVAEGDEGFEGLAWSPDGSSIAYASRVRDERLEPAEERDQPPRRIDTVSTRLDGVGWTVDRRKHVFVVPVDASAPPRQLTDGPFEHDAPRWSPDGRYLAFSAARHDDWDLRLAVDLWLADVEAPVDDVDGAAPLRRLTDTTLGYSQPSWSPDGTSIAAIAVDDRVIPHHAQVTVVDVAGGSTRTLTRGLDRHCAPMPGVRSPIWVHGGAALLFSAEDHGDVGVLRVDADGSAPPTLALGGERWLTGFDAVGDVLAFTATTNTAPPELFGRGLDGGDERQLTTLQGSFLRACPPIAPERFGVPSPAGDGDIDTWLARPPNFDPSCHYPMLLAIHGGPMTQYGNRWFDEVQLYASAGYVVVYSNPHGSSGASEAWLRAIRSPKAAEDPGSGWGGIDYEDLMAVVDAALKREPAIDPERLGVLGGSYGGYMTSWIIGHTTRFAAACSERAVNNMLTLEFTSDVAATFRLEVGVEPTDEPEEFLRQSPITYAHDIDTPVLILHSENDLRCPVEQADQLFVTLRMLGKEVEYWRFPAEGHELSRSGAPKHRISRAEIILDFFARHLGIAPGSVA